MKYKVVGTNTAYNAEPGTVVELDSTDPLVKLNVDAGVLSAEGAPPAMTCPGCQVEGRKRPTKLADQAEVDEHYHEKHPALVPPEWKEEVN